jgi:hypothetical protein
MPVICRIWVNFFLGTVTAFKAINSDLARGVESVCGGILVLALDIVSATIFTAHHGPHVLRQGRSWRHTTGWIQRSRGTKIRIRRQISQDIVRLVCRPCLHAPTSRLILLLRQRVRCLNGPTPIPNTLHIANDTSHQHESHANEDNDQSPWNFTHIYWFLADILLFLLAIGFLDEWSLEELHAGAGIGRSQFWRVVGDGGAIVPGSGLGVFQPNPISLLISIKMPPYPPKLIQPTQRKKGATPPPTPLQALLSGDRLTNTTEKVEKSANFDLVRGLLF